MGQIENLKSVSLDALALFHQSPVLEISRTRLHENATRFLTHFPGETSYAVKANPDPKVVAGLVEAGISTFDVASTEEMTIVKSVMPDAVLHYHNPVRSRQEVAVALNVYDCKRFSVDHKDALLELARQSIRPQEIEIAVRFRMVNENNAVQSFKSKFGVLFEEAVQLCKLANSLGFKTGLTFHPGSQTINSNSYIAHIEEAARINEECSYILEFLNVGGGFPSLYKNLKTSSLESFFEDIGHTFNSLFIAEQVKLECEPGRALVANAGTLVTSVKAARADRAELFLNDGIYGGLMEFYQFPSLQPEASVEGFSEACMDWTIYGPTCDPADVLPAKFSLPADLQEGDIVRFKGVGAYCNATATRFNGYGAITVEMV